MILKIYGAIAYNQEEHLSWRTNTYYKLLPISLGAKILFFY